MEQFYQPPNPTIMDAVQLRTSLLQRIEQADEKLLRVINSVIETVVTEYVEEQPNRKHDLFDFSAEAYGELLEKPLTQSDLIARAEASNEDIAAGRTYSIDEAKAELGL